MRQVQRGQDRKEVGGEWGLLLNSFNLLLHLLLLKCFEYLSALLCSEGSNLFKQGRIELALERYKKAKHLREPNTDT